MKSTIAASAIQTMNPAFRIVAQSNRVSADTQSVYDDAFWDSLDLVCTALDNVEARLYVDQR